MTQRAIAALLLVLIPPGCAVSSNSDSSSPPNLVASAGDPRMFMVDPDPGNVDPEGGSPVHASIDPDRGNDGDKITLVIVDGDTTDEHTSFVIRYKSSNGSWRPKSTHLAGEPEGRVEIGEHTFTIASDFFGTLEIQVLEDETGEDVLWLLGPRKH